MRSASAAPTTGSTSRRKALLVPANRFEVMECRAALDANYLGAQDTPPIRAGALDVLAQHVLGMACAAPFDADALYAEVVSAYPYRELDRATFDRVVDFVATGGYALRTYERFAKIRQGDGRPLAHRPSARRPAIPPECRHHHRGAAPQRARLAQPRRRLAGRGGRVLGKIEEYFIETLAPGDTFLFAGLILRFEGIHENEVIATRTADDTPKIPLYAGGKFPLSTYLAAGVRAILADPSEVDRAARPGRRLAAHPEGRARCCRAPTSCWSRPSRAATASTWSPIPSRAGSPTRRSACC